ncbi:hypothetical protein ASF53_11875 [Methylobacterium sp. Leaf123]|uniref:AIPR family protein n=1 Tax=Methylobacterium sp. Leaf123 TaxID=1736264 RepID=UPI0006F49D2D|nr:AIPR family protein [Methylobacterium sp. Leaf123]KQQ13662.1 hypothetical protein ASF53_11875 [Methylobacterium sp. Leaf123]
MVMIFNEPITLTFPHAKDDFKRIEVGDARGRYEIYRISPVVAHWPAGQVPDDVNPRSHKPESLNGKIAGDIERTLRDSPEDFWLANRGGFLLAEKVDFNPKTSMLTIRLTDSKLHGLADGATTNAVIEKLLALVGVPGEEKLGAALAKARFNLDVVVGLTDHERIGKLVQGRNRSVQVKEWSLADFRGGFDWLKDTVDRHGGPLRNRIGWEENSGRSVSVLDLISLLTLFHPSFEGSNRRRAPTAAFSSKGTADKRLLDDRMQAGFMALSPVLEDIVEFHDHVNCNFDKAYAEYNKRDNKKGYGLGKRKGVEPRPEELPFTGVMCEYRYDKGLIFPLLAAHRCLLSFEGGTASWRSPPGEFFDAYGHELVGRLFDEYQKLRNNPAAVGKNASVYETLYEKAQNLFMTRLAPMTATAAE